MHYSKVIKNLYNENNIPNKDYNKISKIHKYWSRKPWYIIESYINKFSKPGDMILDPFCGSGSTGLEAMINNRNFIGYDLNPMAIFITSNTLDFNFNVNILKDDLKILESKVKNKILDLYRIKKNQFIVYSVIGPKNNKEYNSVIASDDFINKTKIILSKKEIGSNRTLKETFKEINKKFPEKFYKDRFSYKGISKVSDMYTPRNYSALSLLHREISDGEYRYKNLLLLAFTNTLLHVSKLKGENVRPLGVNNYWIPDDYIEENVIWRFRDRLNNIIIAKESISKRIYDYNIKYTNSANLYNKNSLALSKIKDNSIDYIFTDPPYGDAIQYSELSYIWNCWLEEDFDIENELIINPAQKKGEQEFIKGMEIFIKNAYRVLKNNAFFTLCFQNKDLKTWVKIARVINFYGFKLENISIYNTLGSPYNKNWAKFSPKSDFYITFKKTKFKREQSKLDLQSILKVACSEIKETGESKDPNTHALYDKFISLIIIEILKGNKIINGDKINLKNINDLVTKTENYELRQSSFFKDI